MSKLIKDLFTFNFKKPELNEEDKQKKLVADKLKTQIEDCLKEHELIKEKFNKNETDIAYERMKKLNAMLAETINGIPKEYGYEMSYEISIENHFKNGNLNILKMMHRMQEKFLYMLIDIYKEMKKTLWLTAVDEYRQRIKTQITFLAVAIILIGLGVFVSMKIYSHFHSLPNHDFETGYLDGWIVEEGKAFSDYAVMRYIFSPTAYASKEKSGKYLYRGYRMRNRSTGSMRSKKFILDKPGKIDLIIGGGKDIENLFITLYCNDEEMRELRRTGTDKNTLERIEIDASKYIGQECYIKIVDNARKGDMGRIDIDDVNVPVRRLTE